jgi:ElaB/YqjD/DUF883 family membrane-anchored ribosome-binding protein
MADNESSSGGAANGTGTPGTSPANAARPRNAASRSSGASRSGGGSRGSAASSRASEGAMKRQIAELKREVSRLNRALADKAEEQAEAASGWYEGAAERASNLYSGASSRASNLYSGASDRASRAARQLRSQAQSVSETVQQNPGTFSTAMLIGGVVGLLAGMAISRTDDAEPDWLRRWHR